MTLIFGAFGAFNVDDDFFFVALGFFFAAAFVVTRFAADFFVDADFALAFDEVLVEAFAALAAVASGVGAGVTGVGAGGVAVDAAGAVVGAAAGATLPVDSDVVVLLACCVPFVAPKRPAMKGFAMQS